MQGWGSTKHLLLEFRPSVHLFLRRATTRTHSRVEQTSVLATLLLPGVTLGGYRTAMQALDRAYIGIDSLLVTAGYLRPGCLPTYSPRLPSIQKDLLSLGETELLDDARPSQEGPTNPVTALSAPESEAAYLGVRYVVEGAQLGSKIIYRRLQSSLGDKLSEFGSFWRPGSELQRSWPGLLEGLELIETRESLAAAARAARQAFRHMEKFLAVSESSEK